MTKGFINYSDKDLKYIKWAVSGAKIFSTCAKRQYMAIIVDYDGYVVGVGYNGTPKGFLHCIDGHCPRLKEESVPGSNYDNCLSNHAEANAIINCPDRTATRNATLYINGEPCFTCAKLIANTGISTIIYSSDADYTYPEWPKIFSFFQKASIRVMQVPAEDLLNPSPTDGQLI